MVGYQWIVVGLVIAMLVIAQLWAWLAPADPRGIGVLLNTGLVVGYSVVNWLVVFALVYLTPRFG
jgi:hypothetical protein